MKNKKTKRESRNSTTASVRKEMDKPRMTKSARIAELKMHPARIAERPSITMPGTIDRIVLSPRPSQPETTHIAVGGAAHQYRDLRIENTLIDEHGIEGKLKKGR